MTTPLSCWTAALAAGGFLATAAMAAAPATIVRQADSLIDARGMTLALNSTYGVMVNGGVSGNDVIVSANGSQYAAYYVKNTISGTAYHIAVARRRSPTAAAAGGAWEVVDLPTSSFSNGLSGATPWNSHCAVALGVDLNNNKLHLAWDMHDDTLRYRASPAGVTTPNPPAWSASLFGSETARMGGQTLSGVTYPNFVREADGSLGFFYRVGTSSSGAWQTRDYDGTTATPSWSAAFAYDSGSGTDPATGSTARTAYPNGFSIDRTNRYHMTFVWRENVAAGGDGTNHDLCYAYSDDRGLTWRNNAGSVIASQAAGTKISIASPGLVVRPIAQGNGLMNTQGQAVDSSGRIHALMYHRDTVKSASSVGTFTPSVSSYFHYWRDGLGNWHRSQMPFDCTGSRPRMYFDGDDNAVAVLADGSLRVFAATRASNWTDWTLVRTEANYLSDAVADRDLFRTTGVLSVFQQRPPAANLAASEVRSLDFIPSFTLPATVRYAASDGGWEAANWTGNAVPSVDAIAVLDAGRRAIISTTTGTVSLHSLGLGTALGSGALDVSGGGLQVAHTIAVGRDAAGRGDYRQSGGSVACDRFVVGEFVSETSGGGQSSASVSGGSLAIRELAIGIAAGGTSSGSCFTVTGGTVAIAGEVVLGDCGNAATGNAIRVHRLVLGSGTVRAAAAISTQHLAVEGIVPVTATIGAIVVSDAAGGIGEAVLRQAVVVGRGSGAWDAATGIGSSVAGVGSGVGYSMLGDGSALVAWAAYGDTNLDGLVDVLDATNVVASGRYDTGLHASWRDGDTNYDGLMDALDVAEMLATGLYDAGPYGPTGMASSVAAVPEPGVSTWGAAAALLVLVGCGRLRGRHALVMAAAIGLCAGGACPASAQTGSYDWSTSSTLYDGIDRGFVQLTGAVPLKVNCLRIDTLTPGIGFHTTPRAIPWVAGSAETVRQTTSAFIATSQTTTTKVVAAVNGDLFNIALSPVTTLDGFNVSGGVLVSPGAPPGGPEHATFSISRSNAAAVVATDDATPVGDTWNAVTGIYQCLLNGAPRLSGTDPQPRTGLGVSSDTRYVYLMTIDGRSASSVGATNRQVGEWLAYFGAWNGVYVDGGGSTTMAWWNPSAAGANKAQVLNAPSDGSERAVGNNIGVYVATPTYTSGEYYWAGNGVRGGGGTWDSTTATWRSGAIYGPAVPFASGSSAAGATAVFTGAGGQVLPAAGATAERIWFQNSGFTIGAATAVSDVSLAGAAEVRLDAGVSATIRSRLTASDLLVRGPGTAVDSRLNLWPLAGVNVLSGTLRLIDRARVELGFAAAAGTAAVVVEDGSSLELRGYGVTYANPIAVAGAGASGTGWALRFASGDTLSGGIRVTTSTTIRLGDTGAVAASISGAITGTGGIAYSGVGASSVTLTGRSTYSGATTLELGAGSVRVGVDSEGRVGSVISGAFGTGVLTLASGRVSGGDAATSRTILNPVAITGTATLGDAFLTAPLTFAGPVTLSGSRTLVVDSAVVLAGGVGQSGTGTLLAKTGLGTLVLQGTSSYSGGGSVAAGTLVFGITAARPPTGRTVVAAGATLALGVGGTSGSWVASNVDQLFFSGTGAGTLARVDMDPLASVGIDTTAGDFVYESSPGSQRGLVKLGANTLTMTGSGTFSGGTRIAAGRLVMGSARPLSTGSVSVAGGAVLGVAAGVEATVGSLGIAATALVDVTAGQLTIGSGQTAAGLVARLVEGRAGGSWSGTAGITSSAAAAAIAAGESRAVGWIAAGGGGLTVGYAAPGDTNLDALVDILDAANFLAPGLFDTGRPATWSQGDFTYDGIADILDAADFLSTGLYDAGHYTQLGTAAGVAAVPEPGWSFVSVLVVIGTCWRWRQSMPHVDGEAAAIPTPRPRRPPNC